MFVIMLMQEGFKRDTFEALADIANKKAKKPKAIRIKSSSPIAVAETIISAQKYVVDLMQKDPDQQHEVREYIWQEVGRDHFAYSPSPKENNAEYTEWYLVRPILSV